MKKIFYWSPCLNRVGTTISTINSAISVKKYSRNTLEPVIINSCGEWDEYLDVFNEHDIKVMNFYSEFKYFRYLPKKGYIGSRLSYILIYILSFFPLLNLFKKNNEDIFIIHLITSLPLTLINLFNLNIKIILRISGYPKLNFFRFWFWKKSNNKLSLITCPSIALFDKLNKLDLFEKDKLKFLPDAIINLNQIKKQLHKKEKNNNKYILAVGRLTKQKNFSYLLQEFNKYLKINKEYKLIILGEGDEQIKLKNICKKYDILNYVKFLGRVDNVFEFMKNAEFLVLTSLWEDPGFVIIEAGFCNLFVISSDCPNGPEEFLDYGKSGILFKSNIPNSLLDSLIKFEKIDKVELFKKKLNLKKKSSQYSIFRHFVKLNKIINEK